MGYNAEVTGGENLVSDPSRTARRALLAGAAVAMIGGGARAQPSDDSAQLLAIMQRYAAGLRWGTADALVALYTADGVFIRDDLPAATGADALRAAYRQVFATLKLDLAFEIKETEVTGDMAWLRATSKGRLLTIVTDAPIVFLGGGAPGAKPREGYDFAVIDLELDGAGTGAGVFAPAAKVKVMQGVFVVDDYSGEILNLTGVSRK